MQHERLFNVLFGLSILSWAFIGIYFGQVNSEVGIVRITVFILNFLVGILVLIRRPIIALANTTDTLLCIPSFLCAGLLFKLTIPVMDWDFKVQVLFTLGGTITILSFLELGRSFAILPDKRKIKKGTLYQVIRHPAYFGESLMLLACAISATTYWSWLVLIIFFPFLFLRILKEERFLVKFKEYESYAKNTRWRLFPYLW